ncbi:urease accessory protein [Nonomuraea polychroma]|uniref:Urease accessory protein UreF n=1 Tax=Nonomuraea polychroma TaxID=46176 RepID=A0A438LXH8_9ACTN|nr:urease accessory UreF family protein [Nonomuraea polychroma]RVX38206.1 urease accessory protein [Nonomuraea polychroma]
MNPALLLIADSRLPAGGHAHSGGVERAVASGAVHDVPSLDRFLRGRLHTSGTLAAALTAAAALQASGTPTRPAPGTARPDAGATRPAAGTAQSAGGADESPWVRLDEEVDARTASPAQRDASRTQGRLLLRVARRVWPSNVLNDLAQAVPHPHHPIALGVAAHAAGAAPEEAAMAAAYHAVSGPATAAVRLLGLDPVAVHALLAAFTPDLTAVAAQGHFAATNAHPAPQLAPQWEALPAYSAPALDLLAEQHAQAEVRLFVS